MRRTWLIGLAATLLAATALALTDVPKPASLWPWTFTKTVETDSSTYFRLIVNLAYKGGPLVFDIVVGCRVTTTTFKDNSRSSEAGLAPMVYGLKMPDGRGIAVSPPQACNGETTENGRVPQSLLPLVVTYEKADAPWFGTAYVSEDAYENPLSELKFRGAAIKQATRDEWEAWRRTEAPRNFVTYDLLAINEHNRWQKVKWQPGYRAMGYACAAVARARIPDRKREALRPYLGSDGPIYWYPRGEAERALTSTDPAGETPLFDGYRLRQYLHGTEPYLLGLPRRHPDQPGGADAQRVAGEIFPARTDVSLNVLDEQGNLPPALKERTHLSYIDAEVRPELLGFAFCDLVLNVDGLPAAIDYRGLRNRINGRIIEDDPPQAGYVSHTNFLYALERDEYVYFSRYYSLISLFGAL